MSDLLKIEVEQIKGKDRFIIREGKTRKPRTIHLKGIRPELDAYISQLEGTKWLFPSRAGRGISRIQAYKQLNKAAEMVDI
ncbi:hypothetical protein BLX87_14765 [Bacillus sp. VT-16-64]|nr:hypothetical protein BLX87_14765 [Bacillus sp. VT-16-64]